MLGRLRQARRRPTQRTPHAPNTSRQHSTRPTVSNCTLDSTSLSLSWTSSASCERSVLLLSCMATSARRHAAPNRTRPCLTQDPPANARHRFAWQQPFQRRPPLPRRQSPLQQRCEAGGGRRLHDRPGLCVSFFLEDVARVCYTHLHQAHGTGAALAESATICHNLERLKADHDLLKALHRLLYKSLGKVCPAEGANLRERGHDVALDLQRDGCPPAVLVATVYRSRTNGRRTFVYLMAMIPRRIMPRTSRSWWTTSCGP